jgi:hypothetical protein
MTTRYVVISPDGFPLRPEPFATKREAEEFVSLWCKQYERQGYYAAISGKIPVEELADHIRMCSEDEFAAEPLP